MLNRLPLSNVRVVALFFARYYLHEYPSTFIFIDLPMFLPTKTRKVYKFYFPSIFVDFIPLFFFFNLSMDEVIISTLEGCAFNGFKFIKKKKNIYNIFKKINKFYKYPEKFPIFKIPSIRRRLTHTEK